jgi:hypothetical protein
MELLEDLGLELDLNDAATAVEPLVQVLVERASAKRLKQVAEEAAQAVWDEELKEELARELEEARHLEFVDRKLLKAARRELRAPAHRNGLAHALVLRAGLVMLKRANTNVALLENVEAELRRAPRELRRKFALELAAAAIPGVAIPGEEALRALVPLVEAGYSESGREEARRLARELATDERRQRMRRALAAFAQEARDQFPRSSAALQAILKEPMSAAPERDELWVHLVSALATEKLAEAGLRVDDDGL